jgi:hypothetical protein
VAIVILLVGLWVGYRFLQDASRPMFHDRYSGWGPFAEWVLRPPTAGNNGDFAIVDQVLNLLVIAVPKTPLHDPMGFIRERTSAHAIFEWDAVHDKLIIERTTNTIIVTLPDGSIQTHPLQPSEALLLYESAKELRPDRRILCLAMIGAKEHAVSPGLGDFLKDCSAQLPVPCD